MNDPAGAGMQTGSGKASVLVRLAKLLLFAAVLWFVGRVLWRELAHVSWSELTFHPGLLALTAVTMVVGKSLLFLPYRLVISGFCRPPGWRAMMGSVWLGQMGKYLPGKVGSVVWIVLLLRRYGLAGQIGLSAILIGAGLMVVVGMLVGSPLLLWQPAHAELPVDWWLCLLVAVAGLVCLHPRVFGSIVNFLLRKIGRQPIETLHRVRDLVLPMLAMLLHMALFGLAYWLMARSMLDVPASEIPLFIGSAITVSVVGFLAFFAPAGLGVQEAMVLALLGPVVTVHYAAIIAVAIRVAQVLAEVLLAAVGFVILPQAPRQQAA